jgi:hypothetical protein
MPGLGLSAIARNGLAAPHGEMADAPPQQPYLQPVSYLLVGAALLIGAIVVGTAFLVGNFRERALRDSERELKNTVLILSEQLDRSFQAIELVQQSVIDRVGGVTSSDEFTARTAGSEIQAMLADKISGLAQMNALALVNADGLVVNASGRAAWSSPTATTSRPSNRTPSSSASSACR